MYDGYYPCGGKGDIRGVFADRDEAINFVLSFKQDPPNEYADVYDIAKNETIAEFAAPFGSVRRWESINVPLDFALTTSGH